MGLKPNKRKPKSKENVAREPKGRKKDEEKQNTETIGKDEEERGRGKSVGRANRERSKSVERKKERAVSMDSSEPLEREEEPTYFSKMTDIERQNFVRVKMEPNQLLHGAHEARGSPDRGHKRTSRSRSRDRDDRIHKRFREDRMEYRSHGKRFNNFKIDMPCKYFNDTGFCKYKDGHLDQFENAKLHICAFCYHEYGEKRGHSQAVCNVKEEACMYFNNIGNCSYKSGHFSQDGKFARLHICRICFNNSGSRAKKFHSAMDCKYRESNKLVKDSRERFSNDEKPCSFFNNTGNCRLASGHNSKSGSTKQMHICSCCLEFHHEVKFHSAFECELKKKLTGGRKELLSETG